MYDPIRTSIFALCGRPRAVSAGAGAGRERLVGEPRGAWPDVRAVRGRRVERADCGARRDLHRVHYARRPGHAADVRGALGGRRAPRRLRRHLFRHARPRAPHRRARRPRAHARPPGVCTDTEYFRYSYIDSCSYSLTVPVEFFSSE